MKKGLILKDDNFCCTIFQILCIDWFDYCDNSAICCTEFNIFRLKLLIYNSVKPELNERIEFCFYAISITI